MKPFKSKYIGGRAFTEIIRVYGSVEKAARKIFVARQTIYSWSSGYSDPGAASLARMLEDGCDVLYILSGRRINNG